MAVSGVRLTVVQQISRNSAHKVNGGLAIRATLPGSARSLRAAKLFHDGRLGGTAHFAAAERIEIFTPNGNPVDLSRVIQRTPTEIDVLLAKVDDVHSIVTSRRPEFALPTYVTIKAGSFPVAGSRLFGDATPAVDSVTITRDFEIGETKVTVAQFNAFVKATNYEITGQGAEQLIARLADPDKQGHPVNFVNRDQDAKAYCAWLDTKEPDYYHFLPTAAEQEYARRGSEGREYPFGNTWDPNMVVASYNSSSGTKPVNFAKGATPEGMRDLGNLLELTSTFFGNYNPTDTIDPHGPENGDYAEVRGGSFSYENASYFRGAVRDYVDPSGRYDRYGFRVARTKQ